MVKPILEQEYIYTADNTGEYRIVRISLDVTEMEEIVTLKPDQNMTMSEVERTLKDFEADVLNKMQMKLDENYPANLYYKGKTFKIAFDDKKKVKGLAPL